MKIAVPCLVAGMLVCGGWLQAQEQKEPEQFVVKAGTRIPLVLVNSISTKTAAVGDRVYLQTAFPIAVNSRIVIPEGSYVTGSITEVKRPGRIKGKGELYVRFDSLMLRNGVTRDFRGTVSAADGAQGTMKEKEGKLEGEASKGEDASTIAAPAASGAAIGAIAGEGKGAAIGSGVGAVVGIGTVLLTRGSEVQLLRGTALEMQLDRDLDFTPEEINFLGTAPPTPIPSSPPAGSGSTRRGTPFPLPGQGRLPIPY